MKICIEGHRFDTDKAKTHIELEMIDDRSNRHTGDAYMSTKGQWYVYTPSQWGNMHHWTLSSAAEILDNYDAYLSDTEKEEIAELAKLEWE